MKIIIALFALLALGCNKPAPVPVVVPGATTQLERMGAVRMAPVVVNAPPKVVKVKRKGSQRAAEKAAYAKAKMNGMRAFCLRYAVDVKIATDIRRGSIADWGNVRTERVCSAYVAG